MRRLLAVSAAAVLLLVVPACGEDDESPASAGSGAETTEAGAESTEPFDDETGATEVAVGVRDNTFTPQRIEIDAGTTVTFTNRGRVEHNVLPVVDGAFESIEIDDLQPGDEAAITFDEPGDYPYYCSLHGTTTKGMVGAIRVRA